MKLHERGVKADQERAALLLSYERMVKVFHVKHPVTAAQFSAMDNWQVMRVCKDLYNKAPIKLAKKLERLVISKETGITRVKAIKKAVKMAIDSFMARIWLKMFHFKLNLKRWSHV
jgi:hypothetical protein